MQNPRLEIAATPSRTFALRYGLRNMRQWYLIYDDKCEICNVGIGKVRKLDQTGLIKLVPLSNPIVPPDIKLPTIQEMKEQMYLISPVGNSYKGANAVAELLKVFPESKLAGAIISLPLIKPLARLFYAMVAKNRMKLSKLFSTHLLTLH